MSQIPQDIIERVRDSADIVDVVSKYVDLKQRGPIFLGSAHSIMKKHHLLALLQQSRYTIVLDVRQGGMCTHS